MVGYKRLVRKQGRADGLYVIKAENCERCYTNEVKLWHRDM